MMEPPSTSGRVAFISTPAERTIRVEREFEAPVDDVWRAFSDPRILARWWGRGNPVEIERFEFERGGHWRFIEFADGRRHGFEGRFRAILPRRRIQTTFDWDGMPGHVSVDTAEFQELSDQRTRIVAHSLFMAEEDMDWMIASGMESGVFESYAALDRVLAEGRVGTA